jgi:hypothetical protein
MKKIVCLFIIFFLFVSIFCSCLVFSKDTNLKSRPNLIFNKSLQKLENIEKNMVFNQNNISFDLKIREENGEWKDENLTAYIGSIIEFKIKIQTTRAYPYSLTAALTLPNTDDGLMFDYIENSEYSSKKTTFFDATDEAVAFIWLPVLKSISITCSFKARIKEIASGNISGVGIGFIDEDHFDYKNDSINITSKKLPNPEKPNKPQGPVSGFISENYTYSSSTTDPYDSDLYYRFDWGDNTYSEWIGPNPSGIPIKINKSWGYAGNFFVKVQAKNKEEFVSVWSDSLKVDIKEKLEITKPIRGLYIGNSKLFNLPIILIIGKINVEVITPGIQQAESVEFYVNGDFKYIDETIEDEIFSWLWTDIIFGKFDLKIIVYDNLKNSWELEIKGYKFL